MIIIKLAVLDRKQIQVRGGRRKLRYERGSTSYFFVFPLYDNGDEIQSSPHMLIQVQKIFFSLSLFSLERSIDRLSSSNVH